MNEAGKKTAEAARAGENLLCIECGDPAMGGGLWCYPHYRAQAPQRRPPTWRQSCGTPQGYAAHHRNREAPCRRCLDIRT